MFITDPGTLTFRSCGKRHCPDEHRVCVCVCVCETSLSPSDPHVAFKSWKVVFSTARWRCTFPYSTTQKYSKVFKLTENGEQRMCKFYCKFYLCILYCIVDFVQRISFCSLRISVCVTGSSVRVTR